MSRNAWTRLCLSLVASTALAGSAADSMHGLTTAQGVLIQLPWSEDWVVADDHFVKPDTVAFRSRKPGALFVTVTVARAVEKPDIDDAMQFYMDALVKDLREQGAKGPLDPGPLDAGPLRGLQVSASDPAPKPGEYAFVHQIVVMDRNRPVMASILFNEEGRAEATRVKAALARLRIVDPDHADVTPVVVPRDG
jgi:hypothetical protein